MIFWYYGTILGNGNYENHSINPFNTEWINLPICVNIVTTILNVNYTKPKLLPSSKSNPGRAYKMC